jgi:succinoglycan biosynthesis transport protein ExoP
VPGHDFDFDRDYEQEQAPVFEPEPIAPVTTAMPERPQRLLRYTDLVSDLVLGRTHLLLLADHGNDLAGRAFAEELCADALAKGLSVALIDAGTGERTDNLGITDLSTGQASFGDVVQKSADNSFAEVTWGRGSAIDLTSSRPLTLAEALRDIYEVVVVLTGKVGRTSSLGGFAELGGRVVLVTADEEAAITAEATRRTLEANGLPKVEISALELVAA